MVDVFVFPVEVEGIIGWASDVKTQVEGKNG
jgi:hypothetical protein